MIRVRPRVLATAVSAFLCGVALAGCAGSEDSYVVGNSDNVVIDEDLSTTEETDLSGGSQDDLVVDVKTTDLPDYWPADFPLPDGAVIDNVIETGDTVSVTWILPGDSAAGITQEFSNALIEAGFEYGQSEGSDSSGEGSFYNEENKVDFSITSIEGERLQLDLIYGPSKG